jgi:hypothetical protein
MSTCLTYFRQKDQYGELYGVIHLQHFRVILTDKLLRVSKRQGKELSLSFTFLDQYSIHHRHQAYHMIVVHVKLPNTQWQYLTPRRAKL